MKAELIDSHAHLYLDAFEQDRQEVIAAAREAGVKKIFLPNLDASSVSGMLDLCTSFPGICYPMLGLHPTSVKENYMEELASLEKMREDQRFIAIGEIGIDLYWDKSFFKQQQDAFRKQLNWAKKMHLPVVIHARESFKEIFEVMDEEMNEDLRGVFHSFTGTESELEKILEYNFYVGINGIVTFKNSGLDQVAGNIPPDKLLLETDAPFLAPVPYRGKRNESANVSEVANKMAEVYGISPEELAASTYNNAKILFQRAF